MQLCCVGYITSVFLSVSPSIHLRSHISYTHSLSSVLVIFVVVVTEYLKEVPIEKRDFFLASTSFRGRTSSWERRLGVWNGSVHGGRNLWCACSHFGGSGNQEGNGKQPGTKYQQGSIPNYLLLPARHHFPTIPELPKTAPAAESRC